MVCQIFVSVVPVHVLRSVLREAAARFVRVRVLQDTSLDRLGDGPCGSGGGFLAAALAVLGTDETDAMTTARSFFLP